MISIVDFLSIDLHYLYTNKFHILTFLLFVLVKKDKLEMITIIIVIIIIIIVQPTEAEYMKTIAAYFLLTA